MTDTVKLIIEIPKEIYIHFLSRYKYQDTNDIGLSECENVGVAIKNGTPLDDVKAEIDQLPLVLLAGNYHIDKDYVMEILDRIGRK